MREIRARRAMLAGVLEVSVKCGRLPLDAGDLTGLHLNGPKMKKIIIAKVVPVNFRDQRQKIPC